MTAELQERIRALKCKAAAIQSAVESCDGHLWLADYVSQIGSGGSARCVRCGERRGWDDIPKEDKWMLSP